MFVHIKKKKHFKLNYNGISKLKRKVQQTLRKTKSKIPENIHKKLYLIGCYPLKVCENAKVQKISTNDVAGLTLRPIVSNTDTTTKGAGK